MPPAAALFDNDGRTLDRPLPKGLIRKFVQVRVAARTARAK